MKSALSQIKAAKKGGKIVLEAAAAIDADALRRNRGSKVKTQTAYWGSLGLSETRGSQYENGEKIGYKVQIVLWQTYFATPEERDAFVDYLNT